MIKKLTLIILGVFVLAISAHAQSQRDSVQFNLNGEHMLFHFVKDESASSDWYKIYVTVNGESLLASSHELANQEQPTCDALKYIRAWLTAVDNGVNGKKSPKQLPRPGAEVDTWVIQRLTQELYDSINCRNNTEDCLLCEQRDINGQPVFINMCEDLRSLSELATGINQEYSSQGNTGIKGKGFY
ncbi:MAG TPA: hypothetical protein PKC21_08540 [Oligoflexia bacterium]|nr:hypothetical protein [Oligoflexia bacterium]HMR25387.1 hypothetical protein [Oligoflexia bacterium]